MKNLQLGRYSINEIHLRYIKMENISHQLFVLVSQNSVVFAVPLDLLFYKSTTKIDIWLKVDTGKLLKGYIIYRIPTTILEIVN